MDRTSCFSEVAGGQADHTDNMMATIRPYSPIASAKMSTRIMLTNTLSVCAYAFTPASPATPIANPDANEEKPQANPAPRNAYPSILVQVAALAAMSTPTIRP